jgi:hypothetical protein
MKLPAFALLLLSMPAAALAQDKYNGPRPPKPDIPYLLHADSLVETEASEAKEQERKDEVVYTVAGATSKARTPVAEPIFLILTEKIDPQRLELYRFEVKSGNRQVVMKKKKGARPLNLSVTRLADKLYRVEVNEGLGLENGEYGLSPAGANEVFCFTEY